MVDFIKQTKKFFSYLNNIFFRPQYRRPFFVLALVLVVFLFPLAQHALAVPTASSTPVSTAAQAGLGLISFLVLPVLQVITFFCSILVDISAHFLSFMLQPNLYNFTTEPIIVQGWIMVRDICNLFFLLILLFIAFCTILQIEKYHLKKNLLTLVIMALLINFSKPIAIFIFDGAQLLMNYFLGGMGNYGTTVTNLAGIADIIYRDLPGFWATAASSANGGGGFSGSAVQYLFAIIFMFMYAVALIVIAVYLVIRIVALWLIVIISPLAFLAMAVPDFKKMSSQWWDALFKYSYVGPAMAFFLWLSTRLATSFFVTAARNYKENVVISMASLISFITVIVFLYASLIMAQQFGIQFASAITGRANKALSFFPQKGWGATKWGARKGAAWFNREKLAKWGVSPTVWRDAWSARTKEREEDVFGDAQARASDTLSGIFKAGHKPPEFYKRRREAEKKAKYKKEQDSMGTAPEIALKGMKDLYNEKNMDPKEKAMRALAYLETLTASRDFNEAIKQDALKFIFAKEAGVAEEDIDDWEMVMDAGDAPKNVRTLMNAFGVTDTADQDYYAKRLGEIGMANRDSHLWDMDNTITGDQVGNRNDNLFGKVGTIDGQIFQIGMHTEAIFKKNNKGDIKGLAGTADPFLRRLAICGYDYAPRMREQVKSDFIKKESIEFMLNDHDRLMAEAAQTTDENIAAKLRQAAQDRYTFLEGMATYSSKNNKDKNIATVNAIAAAAGSNFRINEG
jgi:hypothetical protein